MDRSAANFQRLRGKNNIAVPQVIVHGKFEIVDRHDLELISAAGAIYSNINDMGKWVIMQLNRGRYGDDDKQLFIADVHKELWTPQTKIARSIGGINNTHFNNYGLGWRLRDENGYLQASHTGGLSGMVTQVTLLPELSLWIVVLTNQRSREAFISITNYVKDLYLRITGTDHIRQNYEDYLSYFNTTSEKVQKGWDAVYEKIGKPEFQPESYSGYLELLWTTGSGRYQYWKNGQNEG